MVTPLYPFIANLQLTVSDGSDYAYLVVKRRSHRLAASRLGGLAGVLPVRIPYSDILHCSAPEPLSRHLERVKLAILRRQRTAALVAEARLLPVRPRAVPGPMRTCYRSSLLAAGGVDSCIRKSCSCRSEPGIKAIIVSSCRNLRLSGFVSRGSKTTQSSSATRRENARTHFSLFDM